MNNRYDADFDVEVPHVKNTPMPKKQIASRRPASGASTHSRVNPQNVRRAPSSRASNVPHKSPASRPIAATRSNQSSSIAQWCKKWSRKILTEGFSKVIKPLFKGQKNDLDTVKVEKKPLPLGTIVAMLLCTVVVGFMILSYIQINEYTIQVSSLRNDLTELQSEDKELSSSLEQKNDLMEIEQKAEELGMVKADQLTKKNIKLTSEDKVEVVESESSEDLNLVSTVLSGLISNFEGFADYFSSK